jgi:acetolactate synthase I/II/III large subunit
MKLNGSQIVWESLVREGVDVLFGFPGGTVIDLYHSLPDYPLRHVLVRHEQGAAHAADGYARASGKVGVCLATSGPGATNLVTGLATAMMDSSPIVAITGQVFARFLGKDAFQETDITGITLPITKHNYLVTDVHELAQTVKEAFHIARSGRPGPVLVDIPRNVQQAVTEYEYPDEVHLPGLKGRPEPPPEALRRAADLLNSAERPLLLSGHGVTISGARAELQALSEKAHMPVVTTLLGKSCIPETHPLCLGMGGMHGEAYANRALQSADVILAVGMRFDDRLTGAVSAFAPKARIIHVEIDRSEVGKNIVPEIALVGDAKQVLSSLLSLVDTAERFEWIELIEDWRGESTRRDILNRDRDRMIPQYVIRKIWTATRDNPPIMVSDVGQNQMWEAQYFFHDRPRGLISSGGLGTMGFALPAAVGVQIACPNDPVWVVVGDGGFQMNMQELGTVVQERLPLKIALLNNGYLGMVRQWQELFFNRRYSGTRLVNPDFLKVAEAYDIRGFLVNDREAVASAIEQAKIYDGPVLIEFLVEQEENVYPMVKAGSPLDSMILRPEPGSV